MDLGLGGLKAILVGANGGIGRAVAHVLAAEGCDVAVCGRSQDKVAKVAGELAATGVKVHAEALDVTDPATVPAFVDSAAAALGGCDIFISSVSINLGVDTDEGWQAMLDSDILPLRRGVAAARPYLAKSKCGSIICMSSTGAVEEFMGVQPYNAMKAAVIVYAAGLSQSLAAEGIRVNCFTPGPVWTDDGPWVGIKQAAPDFVDGIVKQIPLGRMTTGAEIAKAIAFVASPACKAMTGANIVVDGGLTKRVQF